MINENTDLLLSNKYSKYRSRLILWLICQSLYNLIVIAIGTLSVFSTIKSYETGYYESNTDGNDSYNLGNLNICVMVANSLITILHILSLMFNLLTFITGKICYVNGDCSCGVNDEHGDGNGGCQCLYLIIVLFSISTNIALFVYNLDYFDGFTKISGILSMVMAAISIMQLFVYQLLRGVINKYTKGLSVIYKSNHLLSDNIYTSIDQFDIPKVLCNNCNFDGEVCNSCGLGKTEKTCDDCELIVHSDQVTCERCNGTGSYTVGYSVHDYQHYCPRTETVYYAELIPCGNCSLKNRQFGKRSYYTSSARTNVTRGIKVLNTKCRNGCHMISCPRCKGSKFIIQRDFESIMRS